MKSKKMFAALVSVLFGFWFCLDRFSRRERRWYRLLEGDRSGLLRARSGIAMGFGAIGAGLGIGQATGGASNAVGRNPEAQGKIMLTMMVGMARRNPSRSTPSLCRS